jgi:ribosome-binding factor A
MPKDFPRTRRVGEQIKRDLAELIRDEVKDPRVGMVTITGVDVTRDIAYATVYVTFLGSGDPAGGVDALNHAAGFLRSQLGRVMRLRSVPQLKFVYDKSVEEGSRLASLIDAAVASDRKPEEPEDE